MADQSDIQTSIFSSYNGMNEFSYEFLVEDESITVTPEIQTDLKEFVNNALQYFDNYNIPELKCELLGHRLNNLWGILYELGETPLDRKICSHVIQCSNPGKGPLLFWLTSCSWLDQIRIDIDVVMHLPSYS